ncbi:MAG: DUF4340 domain-containing protein [Phycisphaerales bacterium]|nr:DUF4340 domain-containing protein [Phycisphaerales bacterium]
MNLRSTAILAVLVAIGLLLWATSGERPADEGTPQPEPVRLFATPPESDTITTLRIERGTKPAIEFHRDADGTKTGTGAWALREPVTAAAQDAVIDRLVDDILTAKADVAWKPGDAGAVSREQAGLDHPRGLVKLTTNDGKELSVQIGGEAPLSSDVYVGVAGDERVFLSRRGANLTRLIDNEPAAYREKQLASFGSGIPQRLVINWAAKSWAFEPDAAGWRITSPVQARAVSSAVEELARKIGVVRIVDFIDDHPSSLRAYGLERPYLTFEVAVEKQRLANPEVLDGKQEEPRFEPYTDTYKLKVGGFANLEKKDTRYIQWGDNDWVATASTAALDALQPNLDKLRDPSMFAAEPDGIARVTVIRDTASYTLAQTDGEWKPEAGFADAGVADIDPDAAREFAQALCELRASDFEDEPGEAALYGLDSPHITIEVATKDGRDISIAIGRASPSGANTFGRVNDSHSVAILTTSRVQQIALPPIAFASRRVTDVDSTVMGRITVEQGERAYDAVRSDGGWKLLKPGGAPANGPALERLALDLSQLRAKRVVGQGELGAFGATASPIAIAFDAPDASGETTTTVLRVGETDDGHIHAALDDRPLVYEIDRTVFDVLSAELINPQLFTFAPAQIRSIEIHKGAEVLKFERDAADSPWLFGVDKSVSLKQAAVNGLARQMADLRVERFIKFLDADLAVAGLAATPRTIAIGLDDDRTVTLRFDVPESGPAKRGVWAEVGRSFEISDADSAMLFRGPDAYIDANAGQ